MSEIVNSSVKTAVKGTAFVLLGTAGNFLIGFVLKLLIVRNTTREELGIYALTVAIVNIISLVSCLGLQEGAPRHISLLLGNDKRGEALAMSRSSIVIGIMAGATFFALLFFLSGFMSQYFFYKPELVLPLQVISFFIPFYVMSQIVSGILRGHNMIRPKVYFLDIGFPLFFLVFASIFIFLKLPFISIFYAYLFSILMAFISISTYGYKKIGVEPFVGRETPYIGKLLFFSIPILSSSLMVMAFNWADTLLLGRYNNADAVGAYNISISLANALAFPLGAFGFVFMPIAADMYGRGQLAELKRTYQIMTKWVFSITFPVFFVLFFFPEMTISFLFGERFINSSTPLRILSLGFLIQSFLGVSGQLLIVKGLSKTLMKISILGTALNVILNYVFIKHLDYGIIGASLATMISYSVIPAACAIVAYRETSIHPITAGYLKPAASSVIIGMIIYLIAKTLPLNIWMLPVYLFLFVGGYIFSLFISKSIEKEDVVLLESILKRTGVEADTIRQFIDKFAFRQNA